MSNSLVSRYVGFSAMAFLAFANMAPNCEKTGGEARNGGGALGALCFQDSECPGGEVCASYGDTGRWQSCTGGSSCLASGGGMPVCTCADSCSRFANLGATCGGYCTPSAGGGSSGSAADAAQDTGTSDAGPPAPLALCTVFDSKFLVDVGDAGVADAEFNRTLSWADPMYDNFVNQIFGAIVGDCSFSGFTMALNSSSDEGAAYDADFDAWIQQFFGCPIEGDAGALTYGLLPPEFVGHVYTSADLDRLSSVLIDAIQNTIACGGDCINGADILSDGGTLANIAPLTDAQITAIRAELAYLQSQVKPQPLESGSFSFSVDPTCATFGCFAECQSPDAGGNDLSSD